MKTLLISCLTFLVGLGAGVVLPWPETGGVQPAVAKMSTAGASKPPVKAGHTTPAPVAALPTEAPVGDPFTEWEAALKAGTLTDLHLRGELLKRMMQADSARAWQALMVSGLPVSRKEVRDMAQAWYEKDAAEAAAFGLTLTDPLQRPAFLQWVLSKWLMEKPGTFAAWFHAQPADLDLARYLNGSNLVYRPGTCTLEDLDSLLRINAGFSSFPDFMGRQVSALWSQPERRQAVLAWLRRVADTGLRDRLWKDLLATASAEDPRAAAAMLEEIGDATLRREASSTLAAHHARQDPQAALEQAGKLPDDTAARAAWQSALCTWAASAPGQALDYIRQNMGTITPDLLDPATRTLGESRPAEALAVVTGYPKSAERDRLVNNLLFEWRSNRPEEVQRWLENASSADLIPISSPLRKVLTDVRPASPTAGTFHIIVNGRPLVYTY